PTPELSTLSLHDALPIWLPDDARGARSRARAPDAPPWPLAGRGGVGARSRHTADPFAGERRGARRDAAAAGVALPARSAVAVPRSEEHTSELQSPCNLVC